MAFSIGKVKVRASYPTGSSLYVVVKHEGTAEYLQSADGTFAVVTSGCYNAMTEDAVAKGAYLFSENRVVWDDGLYIFYTYVQKGGSPSPAADTLIDQQELNILSNAIVKN